MKITYIQQAKQYLEGMRRSTTGYKSLDELTGGLHKGGVTLIGGRIAMGRSSLTLNMVSRIAQQQEGNILIFSTRCSKPELTMRLLSIGTNMSADQFFDGSLPAQEREKRCAEFIQAQKCNIKYITYNNLDLDMIYRYCQQTDNLQLVVVDGPERIHKDRNAYMEDSFEPVDQVLQLLKIVADSCHVPVLVTLNLHRTLELRKNKRPKLSDLKKIRVSEELVDQILFLYRDRYYDPNGVDGAELHVVKNNYGKTGRINLNWNYETYRFDEQ